MSVLRKFSSIGAVVAFIRSPTGQKMINKAKDVVTDPQNRAKAAEMVNKLQRPSQPRR